MGYLLSLLACLACIASISTAYLPPQHSPHHHHHHQAPTHPPAYPPRKPPTHPPVKPPSHPPVKPPTKPPTHPPVKPPTYPPVKPPTHPPVKPPTYPPVKPPTHPPVKPPSYPPVEPPTTPPTRSFLAVEGVVYCKSCKYVGLPTLIRASPLAGAVVQVRCRSSRRTQVTKATTDKKGYFFIIPSGTSSFGAHKCTASLVSSPSKKCSKPTNLNFGLTGSPLLAPTPRNIGKAPYVVYRVGPFAYESARKCY